MNDPIERQAAIDEAEEWIDAVYCDYDEQRERDAIRHVINGIKELPSAQPDASDTNVGKIECDYVVSATAVEEMLKDLLPERGMWEIEGDEAKNAICETVHDALEGLWKLPSVQPEQKWIPCSERCPEKNGRYLATRGLKACNSIWNRVYIINYSDLMGLKAEKIWWDGNVGKSDFQRIDDVVAWMPLPEPYRKEGEEG